MKYKVRLPVDEEFGEALDHGIVVVDSLKDGEMLTTMKDIAIVLWTSPSAVVDCLVGHLHDYLHVDEDYIKDVVMNIVKYYVNLDDETAYQKTYGKEWSKNG